MFTYEHISVTPDEFEARATDFIAKTIRDAIAKHGRCIVGLSGGSTPGPIYEALALSPHSDSLPRGERIIDWSKITLFLVDERYVPASDPQSNQHLVRETLLHHALPQFLFPNIELLIDECIQDYEKQLRGHLKDSGPDLVILGLGEDGHIASLFPGDIDALLEKEKLVLHTETERFAVHHRITVTLPVLTKAQKILFLLKGEGKKKMFGEVLSANTDPIEYPAHALLETGRTTWITGW